jgi:hypothetical protein
MSERLRIKRAFRTARLLKGPAVFAVLFIVLITILISGSWIVGLGMFLCGLFTLKLLEITLARCPRCGQIWGGGVLPYVGGSLMRLEVDETETLVCRRCRLNIGESL